MLTPLLVSELVVWSLAGRIYPECDKYLDSMEGGCTLSSGVCVHVV